MHDKVKHYFLSTLVLLYMGIISSESDQYKSVQKEKLKIPLKYMTVFSVGQYICSENKGANQLRCAFAFHIYMQNRFSHYAAQILTKKE